MRLGQDCGKVAAEAEPRRDVEARADAAEEHERRGRVSSSDRSTESNRSQSEKDWERTDATRASTYASTLQHGTTSERKRCTRPREETLTS